MRAVPDTRRLRGGAVASPHAAATAAGADVLAAGGNALDAAIATNAMLSVVYPHMCGLGGDLFVLYHDARGDTVHCLNGTGGAPALATPAAFAERGLGAVPARGPLSLTVPGAVAGWEVALSRFGTRALPELLAPAIERADAGIELTPRLADWIAEARDELTEDPVLRATFLDASAAPLAAGAAVRLPGLSDTLRRLAHAGAADLYDGELAGEIAAAAEAAGGLLRADDLRAYRPEWVAPLRIRHAGLDILTTPPNSQGIAALLMLQRMADGARPETGAYVDDFVAAKRTAFGLRDAHVTDARHMRVSSGELLADEVALSTARAAAPTAGDTVYVCAVDADGNACSLIQSIYYGFGSCFVAGDTGILMHNRAHYFSLRPDAANVLAPGKRTLHTLMACMALEDGRPRYVFGTMGADGQPQTNVQVAHRLLAGAGPAEAVAAPRVLHGRFALEDDVETLHLEADYAPGLVDQLRERHARVEILPARSERMGHAHAIAIGGDGEVSAGADPRSDGSAAVVPAEGGAR
jgi:gamma-glutamyltranspeptidase / glutathione hydrolase